MLITVDFLSKEMLKILKMYISKNKKEIWK